MSILPRQFYRRPDVVQVARDLIGMQLFTRKGTTVTGGIITEVEAYAGEHDRASHAYGNRRTKRTEVMFREGGITYLYLCYGIHSLLNFVTGPEGTASAVLIRGMKPTHGIDLMLKRRKKKTADTSLASGPGTLTQALGITCRHNRMSLQGRTIWVEAPVAPVKPSRITTGPRIGVDYAGPDATLPWRFCLRHG